MQQAYDWIGIIIDHIYFKFNHSRIIILPDDLAAHYAKIVLTMEPSLVDSFPVTIFREESVHNSTFKFVNYFGTLFSDEIRHNMNLGSYYESLPNHRKPSEL